MKAARGIESRTSSQHEARKRLREKQVASAYRPPRGNQEQDRALTDHSVGRLEMLVR
jgi:hypothetical protein